MREQGLDGTGTIKGSAQGFIQNYEKGGGTEWQQDDSSMRNVCVLTRWAWEHTHHPQGKF